VTVKEGDEDVDEATLKEIDPLTSYTDNLPEKTAEDEDEEAGGSGQRVQCAQQ
jgi:hypothetical protein